jgi:hypothetical protein
MKPMLSPHEFVRRWNSNNLIRYEERDVLALAIPESSKRFLIEAGLPHKVHRRYYQEAYIHVPLLGDTFTGKFPFPPNCAHFRLLSANWRDFNTGRYEITRFLCLDERTHGQVMEIGMDSNLEMNSLFLNSSIPQYAAFQLVYNSYETWADVQRQAREDTGRPFTYTQWEAKSREVRQQIYEIDPSAFIVPEGLRASVCEEVLYGLELDTDCSPE